MSQYISENNKIILYLTQELGIEEQEEIANKMSKDSKFRSKVHKMARIMSEVKTTRLSPSHSVIDRILSYLKKEKSTEERKSVEDQSHADQACAY